MNSFGDNVILLLKKMVKGTDGNKLISSYITRKFKHQVTNWRMDKEVFANLQCISDTFVHPSGELAFTAKQSTIYYSRLDTAS